MSETEKPGGGAADQVRKFFGRIDSDQRQKRRRNWALLAAVWFFAMTIGAPLLFVGLWRFIDPPFTWLMVERMTQGESLERRPVRLENISPHLVRAVIAAEDSGFCAHDGFDIEAIQKAIENNAKGRKVRGGSTISQQTAKNVFLWAERSWVRKGLEAYFTVLIEAFWPKSRIMEAYLNAAEWGEGRFGAEAAARDIFGKSAKDLTPREAARLAAVLPSPNKWSAEKPGPYVRRRTATIVARMSAVRVQKLDACVWGEEAPPPAPREAPTEGKRPRERDQAPPALAPLPELPPPPETGDEADPLADTPQLAPVEDVEPALEPVEPAPAEESPPPDLRPSLDE